MVRKTYLPEQIINKLREAEILLNQGVRPVPSSTKLIMLINVSQRQHGKGREVIVDS